jgi:hypothetical protein
MDHVNQAAYFSIVSTRPEQRSEQVTALAETILWIYVLDDFLDQRQPVTPPRQIELELGELLAPLHPHLGARRAGGRSHRTSGEPNLLDSLLASTRSAARLPVDYRVADRITSEVEVLLGLQEALYSLLDRLLVVWTELTGRSRMAVENQYRLRLVCRQLARTMASMRREQEWNIDLASAGDLSGLRIPTAYSYLQNGAISIGMYAVAAVAASFDRQDRRPPPLWSWQESLAAIDTAGRIVRLANDLDTYRRETGEGKLTSVSLMLHALGYPLLGLDPETSAEVEEARRVLGESLQRMTGCFAERLRSLPPESCLAFYLEHVVAFALAAYGRLNTPDAPGVPSPTAGADSGSW